MYTQRCLVFFSQRSYVGSVYYYFFVPLPPTPVLSRRIHPPVCAPGPPTLQIKHWILRLSLGDKNVALRGDES